MRSSTQTKGSPEIMSACHWAATTNPCWREERLCKHTQTLSRNLHTSANRAICGVSHLADGIVGFCGACSTCVSWVSFCLNMPRTCQEVWALHAGSTVTEICVGTGPCGELRYPAYQEKGGKWSYFGEALASRIALCLLLSSEHLARVCRGSPLCSYVSLYKQHKPMFSFMDYSDCG